jgi:hypothetical protein
MEANTELPTQYLKRPQVAKLLQCTPDTVTSLVDDGELTAIIFNRGDRRMMRFDPADVAASIDAAKSRSQSRRYDLQPRHQPGKEAAPWQSSNAQPRLVKLASQ